MKKVINLSRAEALNDGISSSFAKFVAGNKYPSGQQFQNYSTCWVVVFRSG